MGKQYVYLIAYTHDYGQGACALYRPQKIKKMDDILSIQNTIVSKSNHTNVCIMSYQLVSKENVKGRTFI